MREPEEKSESEEKIETSHLDEDAIVYAPIAKEALLKLIIDAKAEFPWHRRTPASLKTAEALLKKIEGDNLSLRDQGNLYRIISESKPELKTLEKKIISALRKGFETYFPDDQETEIFYYQKILNRLLEDGVITNASTFKNILSKNPKTLSDTIDRIVTDSHIWNKWEMLKWLTKVEDLNSVNNAIDFLSNKDANSFFRQQFFVPASIKGQFIQILSKIDVNKLENVNFLALRALADSYRPLSDLTPKFIENVLTSVDPIGLIAQHFIDNPDRIPKIHAALSKDKWTKYNLKEMLTGNNGILLSKEAEHKLWSKIPPGQIKDDFSRFTQRAVLDTPEEFFYSLETYISQLPQNTANSLISASIKKYEEKRWFWERWFGNLPESIIQAKQILNEGAGYYKNLSNQQQFELLQCLIEASEKDKRTSTILVEYMRCLRDMYPSPSGVVDIFDVVEMTKEGLIDNPEKFNVATQKAQLNVLLCYTQFKHIKKIDPALRNKAWSLIFNHVTPDKCAEAIYLLTKNDLLNDKNLDILKNSEAPDLIVKKMVKISSAIKLERYSEELLQYLMKLEDPDKLSRLLQKKDELSMIGNMIKNRFFEEIPLGLFGKEVNKDAFFKNIADDSSQFADIRNACNFELTDEDFKALYDKSNGWLFGEKGIKLFWNRLTEKSCTKEIFNFILENATPYIKRSYHIHGKEIRDDKPFFHNLCRKTRDQVKVQSTRSNEGATVTRGWTQGKGKEKAHEEEKKPPSPSTGNK